ncbi:MAG: hypothetical protein K6A30_03165 [Lachnospiraceae bacterium]|nr:hypothetical protein [Lachnospiraceae bacterium]
MKMMYCSRCQRRIDVEKEGYICPGCGARVGISDKNPKVCRGFFICNLIIWIVLLAPFGGLFSLGSEMLRSAELIGTVMGCATYFYLGRLGLGVACLIFPPLGFIMSIVGLSKLSKGTLKDGNGAFLNSLQTF